MNRICQKLFTPLPKCCFNLRSLHSRITVRPDVKDALLHKRPVVALESTIITHGMPYPDNIKTAFQVEDIIKNHDVVPATIGIINGQIIVGLSKSEIEYLADQNTTSMKTSRRDLSYALSNDCNGGTTVSATMLAANFAGIDVFVTGGIGGVHRGASESFDISADLQELGRTPVAVICAGVKSILDIGLTLEYLETQGVPVVTYGNTIDFPSFFTPVSKYKAPYCFESTTDIAKMIYHQNSLGLQNGMVIGVPIPNEFAAVGIDEKIEEALVSAREEEVSGKDITPYVLERISNSTKGQSLASNIALIQHNAKVGAEVAVALSKLRQENDKQQTYHYGCPPTKKEDTERNNDPTSKRPVILGGSVFDIKASADARNNVAETTNKGKIHLSVGGVGRNIAECLCRLDCDPYLISSVGDDFQGRMIINHMKQQNMDTSGIMMSSEHNTASYSIMTDEHKELLMAVGDMTINDHITFEQVSASEEMLQKANIFVVDSNIPEETIHHSIKLCHKHDVPVWFEPASFEKASKAFSQTRHTTEKIAYASPNLVELKAIHRTITGHGQDIGDSLHVGGLTEILDESLMLLEPCLTRIENIFVTLGKHGVLVASRKPVQSTETASVEVLHYPALGPVTIKSVSGAGDSFASGVLYGILQNHSLDMCIKSGLLAAYNSLHSYTAISENLNMEFLSLENVDKLVSLKPTFLQR